MEQEIEPVAFTYALHWKEQNKSYYGVRYAKGCKTTDLGTKYFSSSRMVKLYWKKYGKPLIIIDQMFLDIDEAREYETAILQENDVVNDEDWLNIHNNISPPPPKNKGETHHLYGRKFPEHHMKSPKNKEKFRRNNPMNNIESRAKISGDNHYLKCPEARKRQSERMKDKMHLIRKSGAEHHNYNSSEYFFVNDDGGSFVGTQNAIRKKYHLSHAALSNVCSGKRKSHMGWRCVACVWPQPLA